MKALCNSCLRVGVFPSYEAAHKVDCQCGALAEDAQAFCACPSCQGAIAALEKGHRNGAAVPGMFDEWKADSWTAEGGAA